MIARLPLIVRRVLALSLLVLCFAAIWLLAVAPLVASYRANAEAIVDARVLLARYSAVAKYEPQLDDLAKQLNPDRIEGQVLSGDSDAIALADLQTLLQTTTASSGAQVLSAQALPTIDAKDFRMIGVRVDLTGDLAAVQRTVYKIETSVPFLFVTKATLRRREGAPENAAFEPIVLDAQLDIYGARPATVVSGAQQ